MISDDVPWLFDMELDPDELHNFYKENENSAIINIIEMKKRLLRAMIE
jgi:hypothetical protein